MTARKSTAPAQPVANLAAARKEQAAARQGEAQSRQRHPAGKAQPGKAAQPATKKPAPAKSAPAKVEAQKVTYSATGRCGKVNSRSSATVLTHAVDVKISGRKSPQFSAGVIVQMYASLDAATKAAAAINAGEAGPEWTDAKVVKVTPEAAQVSA